MTANRLVNIVMVTIAVVMAAWGIFMFFRGDAGQVGADTGDVVPNKVCDRPPSPSLSIGTSSGNKHNWRIKTV